MLKFRKLAPSTMKISLLFILIIGLLLLCVSLWLNHNSNEHVPSAKQGRLDLSEWDLLKQGEVALLGQWEFYWEQLLTPDDLAKPEADHSRSYQALPGIWKNYTHQNSPLPGHGYATYRLIVQLDQQYDALSLHIPIIATAYQLMIDGNVAASGGKVGTSANDTEAAYVPQMITFQPTSDEIEIVIHMANFFYPSGGQWEAMRLGLPESVSTNIFRDMLIEIALFGGIVITGIYQLALFFFRRRELPSLFLGLLCIVLAFRMPAIRDFVLWYPSDRLDIHLVTWYEYVSYYAGITIATLYRRQLFPQQFSNRIVYPLVAIGIGFLLTTFLLPASVYVKGMDWFHIVVVVSIAYQMYGIIVATWLRIEGIWAHFVGSLALLLTAVHDLLFLLDPLAYMGFGRPIIPFGLTVLLLMEALALAKRYSVAFQTIETMKDRLILLNKQKDEFLANTSHELKTPLHVMMNVSQSLLEQATARLIAREREQLQTIVIAARRLSDLINDLLDYTRLKYSSIVLERRDVDAEAMLTAYQQVFQHYIGEKPIQLSIQLPEKLPLVFADERRLLQIFANLIENAIKFTNEGQVNVYAQVEKDMVRFSIVDTGIGIPKEKQQLIFQSFEQVGTAVAKEYGGSGLGLWIVKKLVELHGGTITVQSTVGVGSIFSFTIPVSAKGIKASPTLRSPSSLDIEQTVLTAPAIETLATENNDPNKEKYRILVVDDDPMNIQVIAGALMNEPYQIIQATNSAEAFSKLSQYDRIDLVVLDVMMPGISGYDVCEAIRKRYSLTELPVLLTTVRSEPEDLLRGFAIGANDFLAKPFAPYELRARVKTLLVMKSSAEEAVASQIKFLQAQIKPHFLYNALNTILSFSLEDPEKTYQLLLHLSNYLRGSFTFNERESIVSLRQELELTEAYLAIEKARFEDRLQTKMVCETQVDVDIPLLVLQPLVENAVRHGVLKQKHGGTVTIRIGQTEGYVVISVEDDGVGIPPEQLETLLDDGVHTAGIGLRNIHKRLMRLYGHGLEMTSELGKGTKITIRIPLQESQS